MGVAINRIALYHYGLEVKVTNTLLAIGVVGRTKMEIKELFEMIGRLYFDIYKSQEQMMQQKNIIQNLQQELSKLRGKDGPGETP